jgi:uncharacterized protein (DUF433 family)
MELNVELPDFLTRRDDGEIVITGTRVTLYLFLFDFNQGESPEMLSERYPHIPDATIRKVIAFYQSNAIELDRFLEAYAGRLERMRIAGENRGSKEQRDRLIAARD